MIAFLTVLFFVVCFCLVVVVLLQAGKGGGLAAGFGGAGTGFELLGGRQTATFLHRATTWLGGAFIVIAFLIAIWTARGSRPGAIEFEGEPAPVEQESGTPQDLQSVVGQGEGQAAPGQQGGTGSQAGGTPAPASAPAPAGGGAAAAPEAAGAAPAPAGAPPAPNPPADGP